ncbi:MAG: hypothetical protein ACR5LG_00065 [Sodalis sp. (in: enterobacteria)]
MTRRIAAVTFIVDESKAGTLPEALQRAATLANAKKGRTPKARGGQKQPTGMGESLSQR